MGENTVVFITPTIALIVIIPKKVPWESDTKKKRSRKTPLSVRVDGRWERTTIVLITPTIALTIVISYPRRRSERMKKRDRVLCYAHHRMSDFVLRALREWLTLPCVH